MGVGVWGYYSATFDSSFPEGKLRKDDGFLVAKQHTSSLETNSNKLGIGGGEGDKVWKGDIDEVRLSRTVRTAGWINAEFHNMSSPSTFVVAKTPSST